MTSNDNRKKWDEENKRAVRLFDALLKFLDKMKRKFSNIPNGFPVDLSEVKQIGNAGGSTGATIVEYTGVDGNKIKFVCKKTNSEISAEHLENECRADAFYRAFGVDVPEMHLYKDKNGQPVKLSRYIDDSTPIDEWWQKKKQEGDQTALEEMRKKLREHFAVDVLVGNWDVVGDWDKNIIIDRNGNPIRTDNDCSFGFHASGRPKTTDEWGEVIKDKDGKETVKTSFDDLWTMTGVNGRGNGARIGIGVSNKSLMKYFGNYDVLQIANEVNELNRTPTAKAQMKSALKGLSDSNAKIIAKRLEEARQLAERGNRYIKTEDTSTFPRETMLEVLDYSYMMSKEGLREVLAQQKAPLTNKFNPADAGWFHRDGHSPQKVGGRTYASFGDYLADKLGAEDYDFIQKANNDQAGDSYCGAALERKLCVLKNLGLDCLDTAKYPTPDAFLDAAEKHGFYVGTGSGRRFSFVRCIEDFRNKRPQEFIALSKSVLMHDAALQLLLENASIPCVDKKTGTVILGRTERANDVFRRNVKSGGRVDMKNGVCESHGQIKESVLGGDTLTLIRVPFNRIHGLWFMERRPYSSWYQYPNVQRRDTLTPHKTQFLTASENEFVSDDHGLPVIKDGKAKDGRDLISMWYLLENWEQDHYQESVLGMLGL